MIELDRLITYYEDDSYGRGHSSSLDKEEVLTSTITYLVAFKQVHQMLKNLADAIQGVDLEGVGS